MIFLFFNAHQKEIINYSCNRSPCTTKHKNNRRPKQTKNNPTLPSKQVNWFRAGAMAVAGAGTKPES